MKVCLLPKGWCRWSNHKSKLLLCYLGKIDDFSLITPFSQPVTFKTVDKEIISNLLTDDLTNSECLLLIIFLIDNVSFWIIICISYLCY